MKARRKQYLPETRAPVCSPPEHYENQNKIQSKNLPSSTAQTEPKRCVKEMRMLPTTYRKVNEKSTKKSTDEKNAGNRLVKFSSLIDLLEENAVCRQCGSDIKISDETVGIATSVVMTCKKCGKKNSECVRTNLDRTVNNKKYKKVESFAANTLFVLGLQQIGGGPSECQVILTYLELPHSASFSKKSFCK